MGKHRIELLDSFRFIAVLCVLLFHFTEGWVAQFPYGGFFRHIFSFGYMGVQFFFMISGFVISYTLENTTTLLSFGRNRFSRLFPSMLLCTRITFLVIHFLDDHSLFRNARELKNFLPSLTFTNPTIWTLLTKMDFHWINGSYWSLWVEIQFYIISSGLYFISKKNFFRNMLLMGIAISLVKYIPINLLNNHLEFVKAHGWIDFLQGWRYGNEVFNITFFIVWFLPGVVFYQLYKGFKFKQHIFISGCSVVMVFCLVRDILIFFNGSLLCAGVLMFAFFLVMIYKKKYLSFLDAPVLNRIGVISYTIYLIHEEIGVLLINKYGKYLGDWSPLAPFIMILIVTCFAELSYRFYEKKAALLLKRLFGNRAAIPPNPE
jgi:peptidoglycan/LPS O-acetylase OafA/YrhL